MSRTLTASDRSSLIRLASSMPVGSPQRKAILSSLGKTAGSKVASDEIYPFNQGDWNIWAGAESWGPPYEEHDPFIAYLDLKIPWEHVSDRVRGRELEDRTPTNKWEGVMIGDARGISLDISSSDTELQFLYSEEADPDEIYSMMKAALRSLKSGKIPSWLKFD